MFRAIDFHRVENLGTFFVLRFIATVSAGGKIMGGHRIICLVPYGVDLQVVWLIYSTVFYCIFTRSTSIRRTRQGAKASGAHQILARVQRPQRHLLLELRRSAREREKQLRRSSLVVVDRCSYTWPFCLLKGGLHHCQGEPRALALTLVVCLVVGHD